MNKCSMCNGQGSVATPNQSQWQRCPLCDGSGQPIAPGLTFAYEIVIGPLGALAAGNGSVNVLDHAFRWMFMVAVSTGAFTVQIVDGTTKRPFMQAQVHQNNFCGTAQNPFPLLQPYDFNVRGQIQANVTDLSGGGANTVRLGFLGVELP